MKLRYSGAVLAAAMVVAACSGSTSTTEPTSSSGSGPGSGSAVGTLRLLLQDSPYSDAKSVLVTFSEVSVHRTGGAFITLPFADASEARTCDLKRLEGVTDLLGVGPLEQGHYTQIRLTVAEAVLYFQNPSTGPACAPTTGFAKPAGTNAEATVPSGTIHLNRQFQITADGITTIVLDFDGDKSITKTGNDKYMMHPVIAILSVG